jgi:CubicO group peptidase (beta-lactamase class C family)
MIPPLAAFAACSGGRKSQSVGLRLRSGPVPGGQRPAAKPAQSHRRCWPPSRWAWRWQVLLLPSLAFLAGCGTLSSRVVSDPAPAVARLRAGGGVQAEVDRLAQPLVQTGELFGLSVGVITPDGRACCYGYGRTDLPSGDQAPASNTIFQIGSVSKLFIAALLEVLVEEGALRYDDTVRDLLPPEVPVKEELGQVTLYELAINTGGLPRQPLSLSQLRDLISFLFTGHNIYAYINKPFLYSYLGRAHIQPKERRGYRYSNVGYGLLAHLIEIKTGRSFPDLLEEKICRPLNMRDTTFVLNAEQKKRLAMGHAGGQPRFVRRGHPMEPWDMGEIMLPSGCLYSTASDLMVFARASLGLLHHPLEPALAAMQRIQLRRPEEDVALGWLVSYIGDDRFKILYKHGVVSGYYGYIGLNAETRTAVVVLCNTFSWDDKIGHNLVLRLSLGLGAAGPSPPR